MLRSWLRPCVYATALVAAIACSESTNANRPGVCLSTDSGVTVGTVVTDSFASAALGVTKRYLVYLPPSYQKSTARQYPVAYFLHGTEATERTWFDDMQLARTLDSLAGAGVPEMIVVTPDGDDSFWHNWYATPDYNTCVNGPPKDGNQTPATFCVRTARYGDYVATDLVRHIDSTYRTLKDSAFRGVAGLSMGGAGAIYLSMTHPKVFGAAAGLSPAILTWLNVSTSRTPVMATDVSQIQSFLGSDWDTYDVPDQFGPTLSAWTQYDPYSIAVSMAANKAPFPPIWFSTGDQDNEALVGSRIFHDKLQALGIAHTYVEVPGYAHNADFWISHAGAASAWLAGQLNPCKTRTSNTVTSRSAPTLRQNR